MKKSTCDSFSIEELLSDDCNVQVQTELEQHLETCEQCQKRLSGLAANEQLWAQAATHLSTIEQVSLADSVSNRLSESGSFVIPKILAGQWNLDSDRSRANLSDQRVSEPQNSRNEDWVRILDPPRHPEMLGQIDDFEVESKIGQGGMGIVLKGFDRELNRAVAIKILSPQLAANGTARQRFAREAEAAAAVMHPNVVPIYSVNKSPERPYIVMQLVPGHSLQTLVQDDGPLNPTDVVRVSMQIAAGLSAAHKLGIIHRDVKPSNILVERDVSRVMITDFGLARAVDDAGMTQTGWLAGTPHYMSPEQAKGDELDTRNDLFSLGSLMYFIATGREPFRGQRPYAVIQKIINDDQANPMSVNPKVPRTLAEVIEKLLEKNPKNRFQTAGEVIEVLEKYHAHLQHPTQTKPPKRILTSRIKRKRKWLAAVPLAIFGCLLALVAMNWTGIFARSSSADNSDRPSTNENGLDSTELDTPQLKSAESTNSLPQPVEAVTSESVGPISGFGFNFTADAAFSRELENVEAELNSLEQSLGAGMTGNNLGMSNTNSGRRELQNVERQINAFESELENFPHEFQGVPRFPKSPMDHSRNPTNENLNNSTRPEKWRSDEN